ncbi:MAG: hypothetical protein LBV62_02710 [Rickettsiales bacterium]|jgi:hypothetical protein|nr:hypothetical protein [Rickettsiales bacterium]
MEGKTDFICLFDNAMHALSFWGSFLLETLISLTTVALLLDECGKKASDTNTRLGKNSIEIS